MIQYNKEAYPNHTPEMFRDMVGLVGRWLEEYSRNSLGNMLKVMLADEEREIAELLGFIAEESEEEEESLVDFMRDKYGWGLFEMKGGSVSDSGVYKYPEDPDLHWIAKVDTSKDDSKVEYSYIYPYAIVALSTEDGYFVTRMD
jgi:hypothetical protein|tara:strand:- start:478 stop:909 length:432 start_codon:yes stop_codon:yes gene_type:complete